MNTKPKVKNEQSVSHDGGTNRGDRLFKKNCSGEEARDRLTPLIAKDSEWVDIIKGKPLCAIETNSCSLHQVDLEEPIEEKPMAKMFPGILEKDPQIMNDILSKAMSTSEVTRELVKLGQKANFTFIKKTDKLLPEHKIGMRLESLKESDVTSESISTIETQKKEGSSEYEADVEDCLKNTIQKDKKKKKLKSETPTLAPSINSREVYLGKKSDDTDISFQATSISGVTECGYDADVDGSSDSRLTMKEKKKPNKSR